jgi:hypothetical protein
MCVLRYEMARFKALLVVLTPGSAGLRSLTVAAAAAASALRLAQPYYPLAPQKTRSTTFLARRVTRR